MGTKRTFWRPRFSLRTLIILTTIAALFSAWLSQSALRQRRAVAVLTDFGADVVYEWDVEGGAGNWCPEWARDWLGVDFFAKATQVQIGEIGQMAMLTAPPPGKLLLRNVDRLPRSTPTTMQVNQPRRTTPRPTAAAPLEITAEVMEAAANLPHLRGLRLSAFIASDTPPSSLYDFFLLNPEHLQELRASQSLESLDLPSMRATDELLRGLRGLSNIRQLRLGEPAFTEKGALHLATLSNLQELTFGTGIPNSYYASNKTRPTPWTFPKFTQVAPIITNVRQLNIQQVSISNESAGFLAWFPNLEILLCESLILDDVGIEQISSLRKLKILNLVDCRITDVGAKHLANLTEMRRLTLTNNRLTDEGLKNLAGMKKLEALCAPYLPITDAGLAHLSDASEMRALNLAGTKVTDAGIIDLMSMKKLTTLDLSFTAISDQSVELLLTLPNLRSLRLLNTRLTKSGADRIQQAIPTATITITE